MRSTTQGGDAKLAWQITHEALEVHAKQRALLLKQAQGRTAREVEKLVSGRRPGSLPDSPVVPAQQRQVLRFDVSGETLATFRDAVAKLQRDAGEHLDDDALLLLLARHVLGGPVDEGRASYQVALDVCESCQRGRQLADGELIDVSPSVTAMAHCDAQRLPDAHVGATPQKSPLSARATQTVPPKVRREVLRRDRHHCRVPGSAKPPCGRSARAIAALLPGAPHDAGLPESLVMPAARSSGVAWSRRHFWPSTSERGAFGRRRARFPGDAVGKAIPYGIYDLASNDGFVGVGVDHDTPVFALKSIEAWWKQVGEQRYPKARELFITADAGGSNSYRSHVWKHQLQRLADTLNLSIHVSHFPPGTSKWNKVEHRLFSFISMNWRGSPCVPTRRDQPNQQHHQLRWSRRPS